MNSRSSHNSAVNIAWLSLMFDTSLTRFSGWEISSTETRPSVIKHLRICWRQTYVEGRKEGSCQHITLSLSPRPPSLPPSSLRVCK